MYNPSDPFSLEKYSSAVTLSDMEVFLFPELMYSLVLANIMSPLPWQWRDDPWFNKKKKGNKYRQIQRAKQFIMDNFVFNLDLDTWGLTTKQRELARFDSIIDKEILARSNALFGYEGDKYYFDIDIRRHFGLDRYTSDVIPYWKTETIEAMNAFIYKEGYPSGAGECVSLAALYASALFVLTSIPLDSIYLMATPLHSQNYIDVRDGIITNNRRIVTKNMWFNGTELSAKARRALQNERVTVVVHNSGYVHTMYKEATMSPEAYRHFSHQLNDYLKTDITFSVLASFLRQNSHLQPCFQISHSCCGKPRYIEAERVFHYEHGSKFRIGDETQTALLHQIDEDDYYPSPVENRIILDDLENFFRTNHISIDSEDDLARLKETLSNSCVSAQKVIDELVEFARIHPNLPGTDKKWISTFDPIEIDPSWQREQVMEYLEGIRESHPVVDLAFTTYRDLSRSPWKPFMKAALERNPVCIEGARRLDIKQVAEKLWLMPNESIYDGSRMAQPDELWNFGRGDGLEKALCLMNIIKANRPDDTVRIDGENGTVLVRTDGQEYRFRTTKQLALPTEEDCAFCFR
ncbi:MAG: hypothetical protein ACLFSB_11420 [Chitinispirillaceae bacterium]